MPRKSFSVDSGIDKDDIGQSVADGKLSKRDIVSIILIYANRRYCRAEY